MPKPPLHSLLEETKRFTDAVGPEEAIQALVSAAVPLAMAGGYTCKELQGCVEESWESFEQHMNQAARAGN